MKVTAPALAFLIALSSAACTRAVQPEDDSDPAVKARVEIALRGRKDVDIRFITVDANNGVVTISGIVPAAEQLPIIKRIALTTPGVEQVMNNVVVQE